MRETEIIIIGGGIAGAATAYYLARNGHDVVLIERQEIAGEASGLNAGTAWVSGRGLHPDLETTLSMGSMEIMQTLQLELGHFIEFRRNGSLKLINTEEEFVYAQEKARASAEKGQQIELLDSRTVRSLEPELSPSVLGALYLPLGGNANPVLTTRALAELARQHGAQFLLHHEVTDIHHLENGAYRVMTVLPGDDEQLGSVQAATLVLTAGAWCRELGTKLGLTIPVFAVRGQMWSTEALPPRIFHCIGALESELAWHNDPYSDEQTPRELTHRGQERVTRHLYGRQIYSGEIIFGGDRQLNVERQPDSTGIAVNRQQAREFFPFLHHHPIKRTWSGWMPFTRDHRPIIGKIPRFAGLYILTGLGSAGFEQGPMAGKLLAEYIHNGAPDPLLAEADPALQIA
jgi:sarcosine oxidase subunit beta